MPDNIQQKNAQSQQKGVQMNAGGLKDKTQDVKKPVDRDIERNAGSRDDDQDDDV